MKKKNEPAKNDTQANASPISFITNTTGRPTTCTPEITERICGFIAAGNFFSTACELAGVSENTARAWLRRGQGKDKGRAANKEFAQFAQAIKNAEAHCEASQVGNMQEAGKGDWIYYMTFLERKFPERWSRIERIVSKVGKMSEAELDAIIARGEDGEGAADTSEAGD